MGLCLRLCLKISTILCKTSVMWLIITKLADLKFLKKFVLWIFTVWLIWTLIKIIDLVIFCIFSHEIKLKIICSGVAEGCNGCGCTALTKILEKAKKFNKLKQIYLIQYLSGNLIRSFSFCFFNMVS